MPPRRDRDRVDHEQHDIGGVELPGALEEPGRPDDEAALQHHPGVDDRRGIAGYEDEHVRGAAEPEFRSVIQFTTLSGMWSRKMNQFARPRNRSIRGRAHVRSTCFDVHEGGFVLRASVMAPRTQRQR